MAKRGITKKSELQTLVLKLYAEASSNYRAIGSQKVQLISSSIFGISIIILLFTLIYNLYKDAFMHPLSLILIIPLVLIIIGSFAGISWYFIFIRKIQRVHWINTLLLEKLLKDLNSGDIKKEEVSDRLYEFIPQTYMARKLKLKNKFWFKNSLETEKEKELMEYLS